MQQLSYDSKFDSALHFIRSLSLMSGSSCALRLHCSGQATDLDIEFLCSLEPLQHGVLSQGGGRVMEKVAANLVEILVQDRDPQLIEHG